MVDLMITPVRRRWPTRTWPSSSPRPRRACGPAAGTLLGARPLRRTTAGAIILIGDVEGLDDRLRRDPLVELRPTLVEDLLRHQSRIGVVPDVEVQLREGLCLVGHTAADRHTVPGG